MGLRHMDLESAEMIQYSSKEALKPKRWMEQSPIAHAVQG